MSRRERTDFSEGPLPLSGESNFVNAPIPFAAPTLDEAVALKPVQNRNDPTRTHPYLLTEHALTDPGSASDQAEDSGF